MFDKDAGAFLNEAGKRLPNSLRDNQLIMKALEKALDLESKGW